jgi:hypothetical protein
MRFNTIRAILAGYSIQDGFYLNIENPPYIRLVIEQIGVGPNRRSSISVPSILNDGDFCQDPEMCFEADRNGEEFSFRPYLFHQAIPPVYQEVASDSTGCALRKKLEVLRAKHDHWSGNVAAPADPKTEMRIERKLKLRIRMISRPWCEGNRQYLAAWITSERFRPRYADRGRQDVGF